MENGGGKDGGLAARRPRRGVEERFAEHTRREKEAVRRLREYAARNDGSILRTLSRLSAEIGDGGAPATKSQEMMVLLCLAFDLDLARARYATAWAGLDLGGRASDQQVEATVGLRFVLRAEVPEFGSSDLYRQARRQYRIRTLVGGDELLPMTFRRTFRVHSFTDEDQRLVLRSGGDLTEFGTLDVEFGGVREMKLHPVFHRGEFAVTEEPDTPTDSDGPPARRFVLSDGTTTRRGFVRCASVHLYRSEPDGGSGTGTEPPEPWAP
ncbi:hypothetical protein OG948_02825 [Embleya sp. NBC_00888]|uniref:hypothetical protein n=1 Tax=Embleya sp. NBC_00888 TaxID=2975960 RepID=UPI00387061B9|nr:hypothetical protein OG948_02825 [Embleya sp. NBC_00888]